MNANLVRAARQAHAELQALTGWSPPSWDSERSGQDLATRLEAMDVATLDRLRVTLEGLVGLLEIEVSRRRSQPIDTA